MKPIIEVRDLSKRYIISHEQQAAYGSLRDDLVRLARLPLELFTGKRQAHEALWALHDVNFDIAAGEIVGIIGRNGSGKSTLLKILSRIVEPTHGQALLRGRVASLLEVGTGFHPELTGRENIFLNGAILGMSKKEINRKFEEIVAFSEIEKFLDTPVKFYSSGMFVRLAFAVAAHLEPDILIVDEVLAVGDSSFQKKSLGKMNSVAKEGRTVLFVSHNMGAIRSLCNRGLLLSGGELLAEGKIDTVIGTYLEAASASAGVATFDGAGAEGPSIRSLSVSGEEAGRTQLYFREPFRVEIEVEAPEAIDAIVGVTITDSYDQTVTTVHTHEPGEPETAETRRLMKLKKGSNRLELTFTENELRAGRYYLGCSIFSRRLMKTYDSVEHALSFEINHSGKDHYFDEAQQGVFFSTHTEWRQVR